jgi:hypothetical protein
MEANFILTEADFLAMQRYYVDHPPPGAGWAARQFVWVSLFFGVLGTAMLILGFAAPMETGEFDCMPVITGSIMVVGALLFYLFRRQITTYYARRALRKPEIKRFLGAYQVRLTPEGLASSTNFNANLQSWSALWSIAVGPDHAFFFLGPRQVLIVPKRAFDDYRDFEQFVETARHRWQDATQHAERLNPL